MRPHRSSDFCLNASYCKSYRYSCNSYVRRRHVLKSTYIVRPMMTGWFGGPDSGLRLHISVSWAVRRARALSRATLACRGWGHWSSNARCDHRDRRSFSSSSSLKILCPLGLKDLVSFVFARRVRYSSISLSLSFIRSRERSLIPKGHSTKTTKITLKGIIETTFPRKIETVPTDLSSRFRAPSTQKRCLFPFTQSDNFGSNSRFRIESNALLLPSKFAHPKR